MSNDKSTHGETRHLNEKYGLSGARTRLIMARPFLGVLALQMELIAVDTKNCPKVVSRADKLLYNPRYISSLTPEETEFVISHEVLHCALLHFSRRGGRNKQRWNTACDFAVNSILISEGLQPPEGVLYNPLFDGLSAEEIYPYIDQTYDSAKTLDQHDWDDTQKETGQNKQLEEQWRRRLAGAAQQALQRHKHSPGLQRLVDNLLEPKLPWHAILAQYISMNSREDYSFFPRPSNRREGPAIYPSLKSPSINLFVAVDTSSSISDSELTQFVSEINAIKGRLNARTTLLACDNMLSPPVLPTIEPWETLEFRHALKGGRGTDFSPVFDWAEKCDIPPDILIYFTDALGHFPEKEPHFPVLWLIKGKADVPWGRRVQLN